MLGTLDLEEAAKKAAGNWQHFDSFIWFRDSELEDPDQWAIVYTSNRDSGLLDQSNASVIEKALEPFTEGDDPDVVAEQHSHWAVGHVDGYSIRVYDGDGNITEAFRTYFELLEQKEAYPVLDESDFSQREYDATHENIEDAAWRVKRDFVLPEDWVGQVYSWLSDNDSSEIENRDDQGGYPSEESMRAAFKALNFEEQE
jgi:hypothetical protein